MKTKTNKTTSEHRKVLERPLADNEAPEHPVTTGKKPDKKQEAAEAEISKEDLEALGSNELSTDAGEDEPLKQRTHAVDFAGEDLDVPGAELDDANEEIGAEDEENNPYSLGGDRHED